MDPQRLIPGDASLIETIVNYLKAKGIFDEFRHECLADVDTKSSCQNLSQRVDGYTSKFLAIETWHSDLNKNELRNKLRRNLDESGMLAVGADHVVEQVINPKIHQLFLPKIIEVVHQYIKEQNELLNKKPETTFSDNTSYSEKTAYDTSDNKVKTSVSDPIADILSFSYSKSKPTPTTSTHGKSDNIQQKHVDIPKVEKRKEEKTNSVIKEEKTTPVIKEEKTFSVVEKSAHDVPAENTTTTTVVTESKMQTDKEKEKIKKEEHEISQEISKKAVKEELKPEKKKTEEVKVQNTDAVTEESKANVSNYNKPSITGKKDIDKNKQKLKSGSTQKSSSNSNEIKKSKKEILEKALDKFKPKPTKSLKESTSPTKTVTSVKSVTKEEKNGESSKSKSSDPISSKTSESSKKLLKSSSIKKDSISKPKGQNDKNDKSKIPKSSEKSDQNIHSDSTNDKIDKSKIPKSSDKCDQNIHYDSSSEKSDKSKISKSTDKSDSNIQYDSSNSEKVTKSSHYSSSYDSSQGSDQEKSSSSSSKQEKQKHFYKHAKEEISKEHSDRKNTSDKRRPCDSDESPSKKPKSEKSFKLEKLKDTTVVEAAKINSRSNSFGSTSSVSSSSYASKDNLVSNSDEASESSVKDKKKKQVKEKDSCQNPTKVLPPPPPPPPSSSLLLLCESTSAEMSSMEDTQSSATSETSGSEAMSEESSSDLELESKDSLSNTLKESTLNSSTDNMNDFYDIFLYSSSSSEFEGFQNTPEKKEREYTFEVEQEDSDVSVSSVHTSDLSSFDDELSDVDFSLISGSNLTGKKRFTLKEAHELLQNRVALREKSKNSSIENKQDSVPVSNNDGPIEKSSILVSSDEETSPSEPKRSLRRERKLNPRYASSEYTSIFNSRKETFITKQSSPSVRNNSSPNSDSKYGRKESQLEKNKLPKKTSLEAKMNAVHQVEQLQKNESTIQNSESYEEKVLSDSSGMSSADEMDSIMNTEIVQESDKITDNSDNNHLKNHLKLKPQNSSKMNMNSCSLKRKLPVSENAPAKRPCSRSSVDSSSSEFAPNENKPFNSEKQSIVEDKILRDSSLKGSDLTDGIKKDQFCKQRTNNNGDILGQKDIFPKNSHGKTISVAEKKTNESDASKELNAL